MLCYQFLPSFFPFNALYFRFPSPYDHPLATTSPYHSSEQTYAVVVVSGTVTVVVKLARCIDHEPKNQAQPKGRKEKHVRGHARKICW